MEELNDDILQALGFRKEMHPLVDVECWTHARSRGKYFPEMMFPDRVASILIEIGHMEFRQRAQDEIASIEINRLDDPDDPDGNWEAFAAAIAHECGRYEPARGVETA